MRSGFLFEIRKKQTASRTPSQFWIPFRRSKIPFQSGPEYFENPDEAQILFKGWTLFEGLEFHPEAIEHFEDQRLIDEFSDKIRRFATSRCLLDVLDFLKAPWNEISKSFDFQTPPGLNFEGLQLLDIPWLNFEGPRLPDYLIYGILKVKNLKIYYYFVNET
ncbi:hypothetical protein RclHR1_20020001 [Rhizophagus clarus]|uniref:Uncharacterized protein n=1 Tax=Rhizophagus clarus TaxID=94130 RepID=A0A2Z6QQT7_9GLOM|nr:hypothetical protein RclHR1_20020001 [Rhizophagus clarus]